MHRAALPRPLRPAELEHAIGERRAEGAGEVVALLAPVDAGIASGVLNSARQAGGAVGVALLGTLLARGASVSGLHGAMAVSAGAFLFAAIVTAALVERPAMRARRRAQFADPSS